MTTRLADSTTLVFARLAEPARRDWRRDMALDAKAKEYAGNGAQASRLVRESEMIKMPSKELPAQGIGGDVAHDLIENELLLDGSARLNLATFVTTWMPPNAAALMAQRADKNMIDKEEYPQTA